ncbi:hypothetical protein NUU61_007938 [Penicillium alfredii]|uniref:Uncharacterized protein n=1 Tax=Penicillium alfredii TaxID=1506179 RepID=A0A9W9ERJ6_9EURO|nr:uncharacterized protein NUU61_007938 [Penicillium alfredii]KAJ5086631.1 hypothetical protein NUU61_007938 [Penicillium alfredii]
MFDLEDDASRREKCFTTISTLPAFVDPKQIPSKKFPFSVIQNHPLVHTVEAIVPEEVYSQIKTSLETWLENPRYAHVLMPPSALLEHDFFNTYIKSGNILLVSEGRSGSDNVFTLRDGVLRIELGKEILERTGLTGKPIRSGGRKHGKERFLVELNLRLPSMLHGKKGFERIVWAFDKVLNRSMAWLFCDLETKSSQDQGILFFSPPPLLSKKKEKRKHVDVQGPDNKPVAKLHPQWIDCTPLCIEHRHISTPVLGKDFGAMTEGELQEHCGSLSEWLAMVRLESPRVSADDHIDPYLSRYSVPDADEVPPSDLVSLKWHGLIPSTWTIQLFLYLLHHPKSSSSLTWFALSASALGQEAVEGKDGFTILALPAKPSTGPSEDVQNQEQDAAHGRSCICWEFVGSSVIEN